MFDPSLLVPLLALSGALQEPLPMHDAVHAAAPVVPVQGLDDSVPLPEPATYRAGEGGDVLVEPAHGDPFFLGFAAGVHRPAADERIDPELGAIVGSIPVDGRPEPRTYAFVMFHKRMTAERFQTLEDVGARVLDFHPHYCVKVALAPEALDAVANLDFVRWVGVPKAWQKVHPRLGEEISRLAPGQGIAVHVNVYESDLNADSSSTPVGRVQHADPGEVIFDGDAANLPRTWMSNGWQQRRLEELGLVVKSYDDRIRAFRADLDPARLEELVGLDFVQFVEPELVNTTTHDESMAMINADRTRVSWDGGTVGGALVGVIDSGCDIGHAALDPFIVGWDFTPENLGAFEDFYGHGSHVCGSIFGNDDVEDSYQGVAPGLGWATSGRVFSAKIFNAAGSSSGVDTAAVHAAMRSSYNDGSAITPRPHVVNNSYGLGATGAIGTEASARAIDAEVWNEDQLYVFAAGNEGPGASTCRVQATSKNALTVGSVLDFFENSNDPGNMANSSSRGPCGDGRWKPNVSAPGRSIRSIDSETVTGYTNKSGTSMATPHVVGVAAQLLERYSWLRYNPATLSAMLMAGTITDGNATLTSPATSAAHLNDFGTGRIDAHKAGGGDSQQATYVWSTTLGWTGSTYVEFPVNSGATRLTVVVHYKEPAPSAGAAQALRNDFDTWIDASPFAAGNNAGDYTAQQSSVDNTEVRMLNNPTVTDWRIKIAPVSTVPFESVEVGIVAIVTYGDTTPDPTLNVTAADNYVQPGDDVEITAGYTNPDFIASSVFLDSTSAGDVLTEAFGTLIDGSITDWTTNAQAGRDVVIGDVVHGTSRSAHWTTHWNTEGIKNFQVEARSDNAVDKTDSVNIYVDGTAPGLPTNLHSTTHMTNVWSNDPTITWAWTAATDNLSGIDGYGVFVSGAPGLPSAIKDIEAFTSLNDTLTEGNRYLNLRPVDNCGNWHASYANVGPYKIDLTDPSTVTGLSSATHPVGTHSCSTSVTVTWNAASDALSGLGGYAALWDASPATVLDMAPNLASNLTQHSQNIGSSPFARYFHIAAVDVAGNVGVTAHYGPIYANAQSVATYCTGKLNSLGCTPAVGASGGQPSKSAGTFTVTCSNAINNKTGLLFWSYSPASTVFQGGIKCVGSPSIRTPTQSSGGSPGGNDCSGTYTFTFSTAYMNSVGIDPGDTVHAQWWMRDPASPSTTGLSNALRFTVCQ